MVFPQYRIPLPKCFSRPLDSFPDLFITYCITIKPAAQIPKMPHRAESKVRLTIHVHLADHHPLCLASISAQTPVSASFINTVKQCLEVLKVFSKQCGVVSIAVVLMISPTISRLHVDHQELLKMHAEYRIFGFRCFPNWTTENRESSYSGQFLRFIFGMALYTSSAKAYYGGFRAYK